MTAKGLVERDGPRRPYTYRAAWSQAQMQYKLLDDLLHRAFAGDPAALAETLLAAPLTDENLAAIRQALDDCDQRRADATNAPRQDGQQQYF